MIAFEKKLESKLEEEEKNSEDYGYNGLDESENVIMMDDQFDDSRPGSRPGSSGKSPFKKKDEPKNQKVNFSNSKLDLCLTS